MKILLVDDEPQVLRGIQRSIESEMDDWEVASATCGADALNLLEEGDFNIVVTDMRMPKMNGAELLGEIEKRFPSILRIVLSGQANRETVLQAVRPMHQYLCKPCDPKKLIDVIRRAELFQNTIASSEILRALGQANSLPTFPETLTAIDRVLESENCSSAALATEVSKDPMLCSKLLQLANSAIFGLKTSVVDINHAISLVGIDMMRSLAIATSIISNSDPAYKQEAQVLFDHSIQVAINARKLAGLLNTDRKFASEVFSGGLLHDIGKMVLLQSFGDRYANLIKQSASNETPLWQQEFDEFGATHAGIGAYLLELWGLPLPLIESVGSHHSFDVCAHAALPVQIVAASNWIVRDAADHIFGWETFSPTPPNQTAQEITFRKQLDEWQLISRPEETANV